MRWGDGSSRRCGAATADFVPRLCSYRDRDVRFYHPPLARAVRMFVWSHLSAPAEVAPMMRSALRSFALRRLTGR